MLKAVIDPVHAEDFAALVNPLPPAVAVLTTRLVTLIAAHPGLSGQVKPGWRSVNFRHGQAGHICAVFPHADRVALYFEHGRLLASVPGLLEGEGLKKGRYLRLLPDDEIPLDSIAILLGEAIALRA